MVTIYAYITRGLRGQELADMCAEGIDPDIFISSLIFWNHLIYHDVVNSSV